MKLRGELQDELGQVELFKEDFYTLEAWLKEMKRPSPPEGTTLESLSQAD